jgi:hypothetical protein
VHQPHVGLVHLLQEYEGDHGVGTQPEHHCHALQSKQTQYFQVKK